MMETIESWPDWARWLFLPVAICGALIASALVPGLLSWAARAADPFTGNNVVYLEDLIGPFVGAALGGYLFVLWPSLVAPARALVIGIVGLVVVALKAGANVIYVFTV